MKINWKTFLLSLIISGLISGFFGWLLYAGMPDDFVKGGFHIIISLLMFCLFLIGTYIIVEKNKLLKKTKDDIGSVISDNAIWVIFSIVLWIFAIVLGHIYNSLLLTNMFFWPLIITLLIFSLIVYKTKGLETKYLLVFLIFALVFLPVLIYTSYWAITGEVTHSIPYYDEYSGETITKQWASPEDISLRWGLTIMVTGVGMIFGFLFPILNMWYIKKQQKKLLHT